MSNFVVSARKYRPIRFENVVGQQHVWQTLKNAIRQDHLAQAFLFCGPRGVGKTTCARILAKVLNCQNPTSDTEPCDECNSCKAFNENASLNIHELDAASNNSVEHIRALIEQVRFAPQSGRYKIYIIDEVHMLSQAAFNAFLKTLEEPPSYAIFILATTEKHKIIPTILSRCQIFDFNRIQVTDMVAHLQKICTEEGIQAEEEALHIIGQKADGALRDALSIYDRIVSFSGNDIRYADVIENLNILDYDYYFKVVDALVSENTAELLLLFDKILRKGFDGDIFMNGLAEHLRNLLVCQNPQTVELLEVAGNIKERYKEQSQLVSKALILSTLSIANDCDVHYKMARNKRLHVEMALIRMAHVLQAIRLTQMPAMTAAAPQKKNVDTSVSVAVSSETTKTYETKSPPREEKVKQEVVKPIEEEAPKEEKAPLPTTEQEDGTPPPPQEEEAKTSPKPKKKFGIKKGAKGGLLDSITNTVKKDLSVEAKPALPFTQENLQQLWDAHVEKMTSPSSQAVYRNAVLVTDIPNLRFTVTVGGKLAKDEIKRDTALLGSLKMEFQLPQLEIDVIVEEREIKIEKPQEKRPMTDRDKYLHFRKINPLTDKLQAKFQLFPEKNR